MSGPLRVLVVDDSADDADLLVRELRRIGRPIVFNRVQEPETTRAALEHASWDLVISDWSMPQFSGLGALAIMKEMGHDLPFILVSGSIGEGAAVEAIRAGVHDYVLKDNLARLCPTVERELRQAELREAHRRSNEALRASEARYRRMIETTTEGVWTIDRDSKTTFMNGRMATMLGYEATEVIGMTLAAFTPDGNLDTTWESLARRRDGITGQREARLLRKNGSDLSVLVESTPILDEAGRYDGVLAMATDVTERKRDEKALRASEARFTRLAESGIIGIVVADAGGRITEANDAFLGMVGYSPEDIVSGKVSWADMTPPEWRHLNISATEQLKEHGFTRPWEKEYFRKDGSRVPVLVGGATLEGRLNISVSVDLSNLKRAQIALEERMRIAAMSADVGMALARGASLRDILQRCALAMVEHLGGAFARIWTLNPTGDTLVLQASAGLYLHLDGPHLSLSQTQPPRHSLRHSRFVTNAGGADPPGERAPDLSPSLTPCGFTDCAQVSIRGRRSAHPIHDK